MSNWYKFYFCTLNQSVHGIVMAIFILVILFYRYMAFIVNEFISDGIIIFVDTLKMPEAFASVTFLALGNSAIDIIIVCVGAQNHQAASYVVGTLYGQGIFFSCVILSICIFSSPGKEICLEFVTVYRDIGLYLFMIVLTYLWAIGGVITWWKSMIYILVYVGWAGFVLYSERYGGRKTYSLERVDEKSGEKYLEITKELVDSQAYCEEWISGGDEDKCKRYLDEVARTTDALNEIIGQPKPALAAQEQPSQTVDLNESD
jgi:Ca2+/Na+ antiporter